MAEKTHAERISKAAGHSGVFGDGMRRTAKTPTDDSPTVHCLQCGSPMHYMQGMCPQCGYKEF